MFELDRTFCQRNARTGLMEWFFNAHEGTFGPYDSKQIAINEIKIFTDRRKATADDGGRSGKEKKDALGLSPMDSLALEPMIFDHNKRKKGLDE